MGQKRKVPNALDNPPMAHDDLIISIQHRRQRPSPPAFMAAGALEFRPETSTCSVFICRRRRFKRGHTYVRCLTARGGGGGEGGMVTHVWDRRQVEKCVFHVNSINIP